MSYRYFKNINALFHFDYPYIFEPGDGLRDEVSGKTGRIGGEFKLAGHESPAEIITNEAPKFGYRCAYLEKPEYTLYSDDTDLLALINTDNWEIEFFIKYKDLSSLFTLHLHNYLKFTVDYTHIVNTWYHYRIRCTNRTATVYINGESAAIKNKQVDNKNCTRIVFSQINGYIDELVFREGNTDTLKVPTEPYKAYLDVNKLGGFGKGTLGKFSNFNGMINSYGLISAVSSNRITINSWIEGYHKKPAVGNQILIHVTTKKNSSENLLGKYSFRRITAISGSSYTLDSAVNEFNLTEAVANYYVQAILVPEYESFTQSAKVITPYAYNTSSHIGGIVVFRTSGDCTLNANAQIITHGYGPERTDLLQMTHSELIDRFLINSGGGIMIFCGGKFTAQSTSRLGATWDGALTAGVGALTASGTNGGAGYGGGGGGDDDSNTRGGHGGVGGGGGGHDSYPYSPTNDKGGDAGAYLTTGGYGFNNNVRDNSYPGGTQGKTNGGVGQNFRGGGGALGNGGNNLAKSGACLILIAKTLNCNTSAISTGGAGGSRGSYRPQGGGGTGMCYIACERMS